MPKRTPARSATRAAETDPDAIGREVELEATAMAHGGVAVVRLGGRVVFVPDVIPGERVRARISETRRSFWRADALEILDPSPHRRPHPWPEASIERAPEHRVGGADYGFIDPAHQRLLKETVLRDALERIGRFDIAALPGDPVVHAVPGPEDGMGWRTRVRLHAGEDGRLGAMAARSRRVVPVAGSPLATAALASALPLGERFPRGTTVDAIAPSVGEPRLVVGDQAPSVIRESVVTDRGERRFRLDDRGFWQVHQHAAASLTRAVRAAVGPRRFDPAAANLDLFGGVGLFAAAIGDLAEDLADARGYRVTTVESDDRASGHAAENLAQWVGASAVSGRVEHWVRGLADASAGERERLARATVVLDPPRAGAGRAVLEALVAVRPAQIVYVACDPVAFARDLRILADAGYEPASLVALDLFPSTHHLEVVAGLVGPSSAGAFA